MSEILLELSEAGFAFTLKAEQERAIRHPFNGEDAMATLPSWQDFDFSLVFLMRRVRRRRGTGFARTIVIYPLQSIIHDQKVKVNSMGMMVYDLNEKLGCLE